MGSVGLWRRRCRGELCSREGGLRGSLGRWIDSKGRLCRYLRLGERSYELLRGILAGRMPVSR